MKSKMGVVSTAALPTLLPSSWLITVSKMNGFERPYLSLHFISWSLSALVVEPKPAIVTATENVTKVVREADGCIVG
jgi:hypothetical protein